MALCCKMYHAVNIILIKDLRDGCAVTDISFYKCIVRLILHILQILQVSSIGQAVHIDDADSVSIFTEHVVNVIGTDKSGSSGYEIGSHEISSIVFIFFHFDSAKGRLRPLARCIWNYYERKPYGIRINCCCRYMGVCGKVLGEKSYYFSVGGRRRCGGDIGCCSRKRRYS